MERMPLVIGLVASTACLSPEDLAKSHLMNIMDGALRDCLRIMEDADEPIDSKSKVLPPNCRMPRLTAEPRFILSSDPLPVLPLSRELFYYYIDYNRSDAKYVRVDGGKVLTECVNNGRRDTASKVEVDLNAVKPPRQAFKFINDGRSSTKTRVDFLRFEPGYPPNPGSEVRVVEVGNVTVEEGEDERLRHDIRTEILRCEIHRQPAEMPDKTIKLSVDTLGYLAGPPLDILETHVTGAMRRVECVWKESDDGNPLKSTCEILSKSRGDKYWWKSKVGLTPSDRARFGDHFTFYGRQISDAVKRVRRNSALW